MNYSTADLRQVVHSISALFQHEAKAAGLTLHTIVPASLPKMQIDSERIEQVLINLLGNALKFTNPPGVITVSLRHFAEKNQVQISVSDTGIGIPPDEQTLIFDEFARASRNSAERMRQGSGLGLAIAKRIVEAHDGYISVNSVPGRGSTFTFSLPVRQRISTAVSA
jgi:signal transduction histidine kinase